MSALTPIAPKIAPLVPMPKQMTRLIAIAEALGFERRAA
jgi:hypothetical protein